MKYFTQILSSLLILLVACTPKVLDESTLPPAVVIEEPEVPEGPCITMAQLPVVQRDEVETAYVLYRDFYKQKDYASALPLWKQAFDAAPAADGKIKYHYDDGVGIYKGLFNEASEADKKDYVEMIMSIYDKRTECLGDEGYTIGRKAFDYYYYYRDYISDDELFDLFKKAVDLKGDKTDYFVVNPFTSMLYDRILKEKISHDEARSYASIMTSTVEKGLANCKKDCESWEIVNDYAPARLESLEGLKGFYQCDYYKSKYYEVYTANPTDCESIELALRRLLWGGCAADDEMVAEIKAAKTTNCYTPPPTESTLKQGYTAYTEGRYNEAIEKFEAFIAKTTDPMKKAKYALLIAKIYYGDLKDFPKSRTKAKEAASYRPNWGDPYILIGKLYASSGPLCGPGRGWDSQVVTWPAIDMFEKAKNIDPSVAGEANKWINTYRQYMPKKEDIFFRNLTAGSSYTVPCWINERTTIRTAD